MIGGLDGLWHGRDWLHSLHHIAHTGQKYPILEVGLHPSDPRADRYVAPLRFAPFSGCHTHDFAGGMVGEACPRLGVGMARGTRGPALRAPPQSVRECPLLSAQKKMSFDR